MSYSSSSKVVSNAQIPFFFFLLLIAWLPFPLGSNRPWAWGIMEVASYFVLFSAIYVNIGRVKQLLTPFILPIALLLIFCFWNIIQIVPLPLSLLSVFSPTAFSYYEMVNADFGTISIDVAQSKIMLYKTISYLCFFISAVMLCNTMQRIRTVMLVVTFVGVFQAMYGASEVLLNIDNSLIFQLPIKAWATGTFVYKNHYANYLLLCLSMGLGYLVYSLLITQSSKSSKQKLRSFLNTLLNGKALVRIALAIMVIALVMSRSRMGNTAFFAAVTVVGLLSLVLIKQRTKGLTILIVSMFIIDMFILSAWFGLDKVKTRLEETSFSQETRDEVVRDSLPLLEDFTLTGTGMGSFYTAYPHYTSPEVRGFYDHAHNDYLQFAIEAGIPATIVLFLLPLLAAYKCVRTLRDRQTPTAKGFAFGALVAIMGMAVHISVDFPLQAPANAALFIVILALAFKVSDRKFR